MMTRAEEAKAIRADEPKKEEGERGIVPALIRFLEPFRDRRFIFFIFMLLPVRTLFAHQFLTMPEYVLRAYSKPVADNMESLVESINPTVIFFGVPIVTALTKKYHVLSMMILGTLVSALSTFMLVTGPNLTVLVAYFVIFSIGEALWSSRFYEYAAELAPSGRTAQYMGIAVLPWFLAKSTTGFYSGWVLERFCPKEGPKDTGTMWLLYGLVAMTTPIGLILARKWLAPGMKKAA
jgi:MFS family permease